MKYRTIVGVVSILVAVLSLATTGAPAADLTLNAVLYPDGQKTDVTFQTTDRAPKAKLTGTVRSQQGQSQIEISWSKLEPALLFGGDINCWVLWTITPDGTAQALGELPVRNDRSGANGLQELGDNVIQPGDLALGHFEVILEFGRNFQRLNLRQGPAGSPAGLGGQSGAIGGAQSGFEFFQLPLHELQVNVQCVERVADLMSDAGGQQGERLNALAFHGLERFLAGFGGVVENERQTGGAGGGAI